MDQALPAAYEWPPFPCITAIKPFFSKKRKPTLHLPAMATTDTAAPAALHGQAGSSSRRGEQSKREKKRQLLNDRISVLVEKFDRDRDMTYRDQLQKIQVDTRLVQRVDPFSDDAPELIAELREEHRSYPNQNILSENARSLLDMAGPKFQDWAQAVADLHERRDYQLTRQHVSRSRQSSSTTVDLTRICANHFANDSMNTSESDRSTRIPTTTSSRPPGASTRP